MTRSIKQAVVVSGAQHDRSKLLEEIALFNPDGSSYSGSGSAGVTVSETEPESPTSGDLWYDSTDGTLYIYYSGSWVEAGAVGAEGPAGPAGPEGPAGPQGEPGLDGSDSISWTQIVDESGAAATNWTSNNGTGTWSSDGTSINRTDASGAWGILYLNPNVTGTSDQTPRPGFIYEAEMQCQATGIIGLTFSRRYANHSNNQPVYYADIDNDALKFSTFGGINYINDAVTFAASTWFKLRMVSIGASFDLYYDTGSGWVRQASCFSQDQGGDGYKFGLAAFNATAKFKNIKAWSFDLALPA